MNTKTITAMATVLTLATGCSRRIYVPVENTVTRTDTVKITEQTAEASVVHDSIILDMRGDTVYKEVWHVRDRQHTVSGDRRRITHDTVVIHKPVVAERESDTAAGRKPSLLQRIERTIADIILCAAIAIGIIAAARITRRFTAKTDR